MDVRRKRQSVTLLDEVIRSGVDVYALPMVEYHNLKLAAIDKFRNNVWLSDNFHPLAQDFFRVGGVTVKILEKV